MAYYLVRKESVRQGVRRIAAEQLAAVTAEIGDHRLDRHDVVHNLRKTCKRMRALIRLVRDHLRADYRAENAFYRELSRDFSSLRDCQAQLEALERLVAICKQHHLGDADLLQPIRQWLFSRRSDAEGDEGNLQDRLDQAIPKLQRARQRVLDWKIPKGGFEVVQPGLLLTYSRARNCLPLAYATRSDTAFHEWRKRVKYHWYHADLLGKMAPVLLRGHRDLTNRLGEMLGQDHDYTVLGETVCEHLMGGSAETSTPQPSVLLLEALIQFRQRQLRREAWSIGHQVLAEKPKALGKRWSAYWSAWHSRPPQAVTAKRVNRQDTLGAARPVTQDAEQAPSPDRSDRIAPKQ